VVFGFSANLLANTDPAAPAPMIITSYFMDPPYTRCLLRWDVSELTDSPEGHFFWYEPLDGDARVHHGSHEAPLEGLPSSLA
jgi:hypothetical protein